MRKACFNSWGRMFPGIDLRNIQRPKTVRELQDFMSQCQQPMLAIGQGKSYGDVGLNYDGPLLDLREFDHFLAFDEKIGELSVAAGATFADILRSMVPRGWFLPVVPGTQLLSVGGAIANDIHGKNHHVAGTIGRHLEGINLLRGGTEVRLLRQGDKSDLFSASIGGLGLTGVIRSANLRMNPIESAYFDVDYVPFNTLEDFIALSDASDADFDYTVAWVDCLGRGGREDGPRGIFMRGRHSRDGNLTIRKHRPTPTIPLDFPNWTLNSSSVKLFNEFYFWAHKQLKKGPQKVYYEDFLFPLDHIRNWNRIYGKSGFYQYQFVLPRDQIELLREIFARIRHSNLASFLAVLKKFGDMPSPGMMSFPMPGYTLALDFPGRLSQKVLGLFTSLDELVEKAGGRLYPAKDSCMSEELFKKTYPRWQDFSTFIDVKFSSAFAKRVGLCR